MKTLFIITLLVATCFGEYQTGKIDMHGGKDGYLYDNKKSAFGKSSVGMSIFLDKNSTKKTTQTKVK